MKHERINPSVGDAGAGDRCAERHATEDTQLRDPKQHALAALRLGLRYHTNPEAVAPVARLLLEEHDILWIAAVCHHAMPPELADEFHRAAVSDLWCETDWRGGPGL